MPKPEQLPDRLQNFAYVNAAPVDTGRDFHRDLNRVIAALNKILGLPLNTVERAAFVAETVSAPAVASSGPIGEPKSAGDDGEPIAVAADPPRVERAMGIADIDGAGTTSRATTENRSLWRPIRRASSAPWALPISTVPAPRRAVVTNNWPQRSAASSLYLVRHGGFGRERQAWPRPSISHRSRLRFRTQSMRSGRRQPWRRRAPFRQRQRRRQLPRCRHSHPLLNPRPYPHPFRHSKAQTAFPQILGADAVRAFYSALSQGNGGAAAALVVPERQKGGLSAQQMTAFFSKLAVPLQLISVVPSVQNTYQATYTYRATTNVCTNTVIVAVTGRNGRYLIQNIDPRGGC